MSHQDSSGYTENKAQNNRLLLSTYLPIKLLEYIEMLGVLLDYIRKQRSKRYCNITDKNHFRNVSTNLSIAVCYELNF